MVSTETSEPAVCNRSQAIAAACVFLFLIAIGLLAYWHPLYIADTVVRLKLRAAGVDSRFTQVGSYRVHYFVGGKGKPLVLIHGLGARSDDWAPEIPGYVKHGFRVYALDLLGYGESSHPDIAYTMQQQADFVDGFMTAMHLPKADVAGWSMGGWIALELALHHPQRVERLVLMDSAGLTFKVNFNPNIFTPVTTRQLAQLWGRLTPNPKPLPSFLARAILRRINKGSWVIHRTISVMQTRRELLDGQLTEIHVPVLIVWGAQDRLIPPSSGEQMHLEIPHSVLELFQGCGHIAPANCASQIVPHVRQFLDSRPAMAGGTYQY